MPSSIIKFYNQYRDDKKKQMVLETLECKLSNIIVGAKSKVVSIAKRKKSA